MPWIQVGRWRLDLSRIELVYEADVGSDGEKSVVVTLRNGTEVNLAGADAAAFLSAFDGYRAARDISRGPPERIAHLPRVILPASG